VDHVPAGRRISAPESHPRPGARVPSRSEARSARALPNFDIRLKRVPSHPSVAVGNLTRGESPIPPSYARRSKVSRLAPGVPRRASIPRAFLGETTSPVPVSHACPVPVLPGRGSLWSGADQGSGKVAGSHSMKQRVRPGPESHPERHPCRTLSGHEFWTRSKSVPSRSRCPANRLKFLGLFSVKQRVPSRCPASWPNTIRRGHAVTLDTDFGPWTQSKESRTGTSSHLPRGALRPDSAPAPKGIPFNLPVASRPAEERVSRIVETSREVVGECRRELSEHRMNGSTRELLPRQTFPKPTAPPSSSCGKLCFAKHGRDRRGPA
jgi:hypothetical protein